MKNKGITLVALVVTIVIMLILAGVTLNLAIGDNGLFKMAEKTVDSYQLEGEREAIEMSVATYQLGKNTNQEGIEDSRLGKSLADRNFENGDTWDEVKDTLNDETYGDGWNYVEKKKDNIEGFGIAEHNWLVNYETGDIIELGEKDKDYYNWDWKSTVGVTEGLILNLDSASVTEDKSSLGENTDLYCYDTGNYETIEQRKAGYEAEKRTHGRKLPKWLR